MARLKDNSNVDHHRHIGRWAMTLNHFLFRVEHVHQSMGEVLYTGTGLHGQPVSTAMPVEICREEDEEWINEHQNHET